MTKDLDKINRKLNENKKLKRFLIISVSAIVFLFVFDLILMPWFVYEPEVTVPNLVKKSRIDAEKLLEDKSLNVFIAGTHYDAKIPRNHVIAQDPPAYSIVKEGRRISVHLSGGEPMVKMPSLVGKSLRDTKINLDRLGLKIGTVTSIESEFDNEIVVKQYISSGEQVSRGTKIDIAISSGPAVQKTVVPNLYGKSLDEAKRLLVQNSLVMGTTTSIPSPTLLPNTIMDQYPAPDKEVAVGDAVDLVVSKLTNSK
ncbi:MAG: PASTA domain-containing protein [bacterium]